MMKELPRFRSALRRVLPGRLHAFSRMLIRRTAEVEASRAGATSTVVMLEVIHHHRNRLTPEQAEQLNLALKLDIPESAPVEEVDRG